MDLWLISPAWGRFDVTRLVLAERRWMCDELASRGWAANSVVIADDDNLDIAAEYGFPTVEMPNNDLGEKFNAGYRYAAAQGADVFVHIGSDDWVHPDAFRVLDEVELDSTTPPAPAPGAPVVWRRGPQVVAQRRLLLIDLPGGVGRRCFIHGRWGCIPWMIPRSALQPHGFSPIPSGHMRGIDGALVRGMKTRPNWFFQDAPDEWCVDFKTATNVTPYRGLANTLGVDREQEPWEMLSDFYPADLVAQAEALAR